MPELPDVTVYLEALDRKVVGSAWSVKLRASPFVLRSYDPPLDATRRQGGRAACAASANASCSTSTTASSW